jgi:hypothetical protein
MPNHLGAISHTYIVMRILLPLIVAGTFSFNVALAQTSQHEQTIAKMHEAIELMDNGTLDESITLLNEIRKLDPSLTDAVYEPTVAKYRKKDDDEALKDLKSLIKQKAATAVNS